MNTLQLSKPTPTGGWDLVLTADGNLAVLTGPAAIAQDVASEVRTFEGECWYDTTKGVPYLTQILDKLPSLQFLKRKFIAAALRVPNVAGVLCFLTGPSQRTRQLGGQLQITDDDGVLLLVETPSVAGVAPWYVVGASSAALGPGSFVLGQSPLGGPDVLS